MMAQGFGFSWINAYVVRYTAVVAPTGGVLSDRPIVLGSHGPTMPSSIDIGGF